MELNVYILTHSNQQYLYLGNNCIQVSIQLIFAQFLPTNLEWCFW